MKDIDLWEITQVCLYVCMYVCVYVCKYAFILVSVQEHRASIR